MTTPAQTLLQAQIAELIPHSGTMCLLQNLDEWDMQHIVCRADSHRDLHNPLRTHSGLLAPNAIEYAAQAMALHGALIGIESGVPATPGYLASTRGVRLYRLRLDDLPAELHITATRQAGDARQILYAFTVSHAGEPVAEGRAAVVLNTPLA
ncbi:MAG: hydroxymyristoyl-ACP dehydratase [Telluria sp.]|nr:hydroxymyristoyl-ACP dehydratase [Telluria sp.]